MDLRSDLGLELGLGTVFGPGMKVEIRLTWLSDRFIIQAKCIAACFVHQYRSHYYETGINQNLMDYEQGYGQALNILEFAITLVLCHLVEEIQYPGFERIRLVLQDENNNI